jgi:hypothetical protein
MSEDLAFWTGLLASSEISILSLVSTLVLALAILLYSFLAVQRRNGSQQRQTHHRDMDTGPPTTIVQDQQKALYHMVKFSIRLKRKLKKIRASHSQQSPDFCEKKSDDS